MPKQALAQMQALKALHAARDCPGKRFVEGIVEVQARGKEMIVVLDRSHDSPHIMSMDAVF